MKDIFAKAEFLTLDPEKYPEFHRIPETIFTEFDRKFFAAQFARSIPAERGSKVHIAIFADTKFRLTVNGHCLGVGPVAAGGDYDNVRAMPKQYYSEYDTVLDCDTLDILAEVQSPGLVMTDYSVGRGGFIFHADIISPSGETGTLDSDGKWLVRRDTRYPSHDAPDYRVPLPEWEVPTVVPKGEAPWKLFRADIPTLTEELIEPSGEWLNDGRRHFDFSRIYSAYYVLEVDSPVDGAEVGVLLGEISRKCYLREKITFPKGRSVYRSFQMYSVGELELDCPDSLDIKVSLVYQHYPVTEAHSGNFACSDKTLTDIYNLGRFTLEMCRQSLHLDSPLHQETLGCTGDYAIEQLMTAVTFGDQRLSRLDLIRTGDLLEMNGCKMFHTSYSLIFVTMLRDYYRYTADLGTVAALLPTVSRLLALFETYEEDGVISNPPNYMFIEWGKLDGYNLHHPPKALGQTAMNAFYQMALSAEAELYATVGNGDRADAIRKKASEHRDACRAHFYDKECGLYKDGECAPDSVYVGNRWLPENSERIYHTRHANILAALSGIAEDGGALIRRVITHKEDFEDFDIQPYFMHYLMEAVRKFGMFSEFGLELLHLWDKQLADCPKGMREGWGEFDGDRSHAWGATPTYQLPMAVTGFEMLDAGYRRFSLTPKLYSLDWAEVTLPTPCGLVGVKLKRGAEPIIKAPDGYLVNESDGSYSFTLSEA